MSTQKNIHDAFLWARQVYDETRVLFDDARRMATELGYDSWDDAVLTGYAATLKPNEFPFVYLAVLFFSPKELIDKDEGTSIFLAVDFHSDLRKGPHLLVGTLRHTSCNWNKKDLVNETARRYGGQGYFETKKPAPGEVIYVHTPIGSYKTFAGADELKHVEIPLTSVDTPDRLREVLLGTIALRDGDPSKLAPLVAASAASEAPLNAAGC